MLTRRLLGELEEHWVAQGAPLLQALRPGLTSEEIDTKMHALNLRLPAEAKEWWTWHDGVGPTVSVGVERELGPGLPFLPLDEAIELYRHARTQAVEVAGERADYWWRPSWFPITERRGEIRCDCSVEPGAPTPIYWAYSHDHDADGLTRPKVPTFGTMVTWWVDALASGAWSYRPETKRWERHRELIDVDRDESGLV